MRILISMIAFFLLFTGCETGEDYKEVRSGVVREHDKVMLDNQRADENRERLNMLLSGLDSLKQVYPDIDTVHEKAVIQHLMERLSLADTKMDTWMQEFDAELGSKTNDEAVAYFRQEQLRLVEIDSLFKDILNESGEYLRKF